MVLPGPIRQIGYVVRDLDRAIDQFCRLGVGPWFVLRELPQQVSYRGAPCTVTLSLALANSGDLQVELIQQHGDTPSIFTEFLSSGREGFHQLAWWPEDFDAAVQSVRDAGWPVVWSGGDAATTRFVYVEPPGPAATIVEIMELTELTAGLAQFIKSAAADWDGSDPIRPLGG